MTQTERLLARIKQVCKENPGTAVKITIITGADGEPAIWFPELCFKVDGNDDTLVAAGIKPATRKVMP